MLPHQVVLREPEVLGLVDNDEEGQANFELSDLISLGQLDVLIHFREYI